MIISKKRYNMLVSHNKKLTQETYDLEKQIEYLTETNHGYYTGAIKWIHAYDKMWELFANGKKESPIVLQRNAEIHALKHMIERLEAEHEKGITLIRALNKENDKLFEELNMGQRKLDLLSSMLNEHLEVAKLFDDGDDVIMWEQLLKVVGK